MRYGIPIIWREVILPPLASGCKFTPERIGESLFIAYREEVILHELRKPVGRNVTHQNILLVAHGFKEGDGKALMGGGKHK